VRVGRSDPGDERRLVVLGDDVRHAHHPHVRACGSRRQGRNQGASKRKCRNSKRANQPAAMLAPGPACRLPHLGGPTPGNAALTARRPNLSGEYARCSPMFRRKASPEHHRGPDRHDKNDHQRKHNRGNHEFPLALASRNLRVTRASCKSSAIVSTNARMSLTTGMSVGRLAPPPDPPNASMMRTPSA
jgi:hypothetical protein